MTKIGCTFGQIAPKLFLHIARVSEKVQLDNRDENKLLCSNAGARRQQVISRLNLSDIKYYFFFNSHVKRKGGEIENSEKLDFK